MACCSVGASKRRTLILYDRQFAVKLKFSRQSDRNEAVKIQGRWSE
ncbi:hypothetical protein NSP_13540 [Nodularia spumigena CCY9414]|nr:hypothetical protein NSP_13540 [Nodularia spumigena CCY9414]